MFYNFCFPDIYSDDICYIYFKVNIFLFNHVLSRYVVWKIWVTTQYHATSTFVMICMS